MTGTIWNCKCQSRSNTDCVREEILLDEQNDRQYCTVGCLTPSKIELVDLDEPRRRAQDIDGQIRTIHEDLELKRGKSFNKPSKSGVSGPVKFEAPYQKWTNLITSPMRKIQCDGGHGRKEFELLPKCPFK